MPIPWYRQKASDLCDVFCSQPKGSEPLRRWRDDAPRRQVEERHRERGGAAHVPGVARMARSGERQFLTQRRDLGPELFDPSPNDDRLSIGHFPTKLQCAVQNHRSLPCRLNTFEPVAAASDPIPARLLEQLQVCRVVHVPERVEVSLDDQKRKLVNSADDDASAYAHGGTVTKARPVVDPKPESVMKRECWTDVDSTGANPAASDVMGSGPFPRLLGATGKARHTERPPAVCLALALWLSLPSAWANAAEPRINACQRPAEDLYSADWSRPEMRPATTRPPASAKPAAPAPSDHRPTPKPKPQTTKPRLELSFGSTERFYNQSLYDPGGFVTRRAIPVSTIRPLVDWLFQQHASVWLSFDLPLEPRSELLDDKVVLTYVPPSLEAGVRFGLFEADVMDEISLGLQVDGGLGWVFSSQSDVRLFPHLGWRLHLWDNSGFTAYLGASYEFRLSVGALVYGVGHLF